MFYYFLYPLASQYALFNVFKYITFRTFGATITSVLCCLFFGPAYIRWLQRKQMGQMVREDGPKTHFVKKGTPTMGGGLILMAISVSTLLWGDLSNIKLWFCWGTTILFGIIGYIDDHRKVVQKNFRGLSAKKKLLLQFSAALLFSFGLWRIQETPPVLTFPFFKEWALPLHLFFIPFASFVVVGASNAVNLTDGLDGLAVGPTMSTASTFLLLAYCAGHIKIAEYLQIPYISGAGELSIFCGAIAAACLGFLWFNTYPAQVFMGDVGSLALGAALGTVAVVTKNEILLAICGGVFVMEALSVMAQVLMFKTTGRRVLKMAPLHHHFELKGWAEPKVIVRFWIVSILLALFTLSTLKLR